MTNRTWSFPPFTPGYPKGLHSKRKHSNNVLDLVAKQDILLHHPFESFTPVVDMLRQAAKDPDVLAIRQTLYRTGAHSEMVDALVEAARQGKDGDGCCRNPVPGLMKRKTWLWPVVCRKQEPSSYMAW